MKVLESISFQCKAEENILIIGANQSGKSLLIQCLAGLFPYTGSLINHAQKSGVLFQNNGLFTNLTNKENVAFPLIHDGYSQDTAYKKAISMLEEFFIDPIYADAYPHEISGGMRKRTALARTFIYNPDLLLLDAPTSGLDPILSQRIKKKIFELAKNKTLLYTSDEPIKRINRFDKVLFLKNKKCTTYTPEEYALLNPFSTHNSTLFNHILESYATKQ